MTDTNSADVLISAKAVLSHFNPPSSVRTLDRWLARSAHRIYRAL